MEIFAFLVVAVLIYWFLIRPIVSGYKQGVAEDQTSAQAQPQAVISAPNSEPQGDNWEGSFWEVQSPRNIEANLSLDYRDASGTVTKRNIRLMKYGPWEDGAILWAFCNLRQANRTFRTDRIISCVDLDTGEVVENLESWLDAKYQASPDRALEKVIEEAWDAVRVLFYVSKADGRLTQKERSILRDAIRQMSDHPAIDDKRIDGLIASLDTPTVMAFKQAFGRLCNQTPDLAQKVADWTNSLVATEKTISPQEQEAVDYINGRLR